MTPLFMNAAYCITLFLAGLAIGSFLCRRCLARIPGRYLLAEIATGLLWGATGWKIAQLRLGCWTDVATGVIWLAFVSAAVVTFIVDCDRMIILDEISVGGTILSIALAPLVPAGSFGAALLGAASGAAFSAAFLFFGNAVFKKQIAEAQKTDPDIRTALGWGDVKLTAFYGAFLGWMPVLAVFLIASVPGAVVGLARRRSKGSVVPFGPFLACGAVLYFFCAPQIPQFFAFL